MSGDCGSSSEHQKGETKSVEQKGKIEQNYREGLDKRCAWLYLLVPESEFPSSFLSPVNSCPWKCLTDLNQIKLLQLWMLKVTQGVVAHL